MWTSTRVLALAAAIGTAGQSPAAAQQLDTRQQSIDTARVDADPALVEALRHRQRAIWDVREDTVPFVISASGGISLGAYQAGVTWALVRFMRHLDARPDMTRDSLGVGVPRLAATTGASAGNINAVLSAIEWCTPTPSDPEQSLFWKIWVSVGWPELFPDHRVRSSAPAVMQASAGGQQDAGVFDRAFFKQHLFPVVESRLSGATRPGCNGIPIGVTATRLEPTQFPVTDRLYAVTQRYASIFQLKQLPNGRVAFSQPDAQLRDRGMGAMLALAVGATDVIPPADIFTLIEASSAFPVAFSPRILRYYHADSLRDNGHCQPSATPMEPCAPPRRAFFTDGGVFDNNPLQLALDVYERKTRVVRLQAEGFSEGLSQFAIVPARALYVGTDQYRNVRLRETRSIGGEPDSVGGLAAVRTLLGGAVPAARQYEMQTLARSLARDRVMPREYIRTTDRHLPVFGDHLAAFGAFLGRPMREWDFYTGVYDGLHFVASDVICAQGSRALAGYVGPTAHQDCSLAAKRLLIGGYVIPLGAVGPYVLADMLSHELAGTTGDLAVQPSHLQPTDAQRLRVLRALTRAQVRQISRGEPACVTKDWAKALVCGGHMDSLMADIRADSVARRIISQWQRAPECRASQDPVERPCLADETFVNFVENPASEVKHRVGHVLNRLWTVENTIRDRNEAARAAAGGDAHRVQPIREYASWVEFSEFLLRSYDWPARRGRDLDPSSIPPENAPRLLRFGTSLLPYHVSVGLHIGGYEVGWTPIIHSGEHWAWQFPTGIADMHQSIELGDIDRRRQITLGVGVLYKAGGLVAPAFGLAARPIVAAYSFDDRFARWSYNFQNMISYEATAYLLAGKARASVYTVPVGVVSERRWGARIGLADVPGIVYWIIR